MSNEDTPADGFKQTEVGLIPEEWESATLGTLQDSGLLRIQNGFPCGDHNLEGRGSGFLKSFVIPLPAIDEQRDIARILQSVDAKIAAAERKRAGLEELFRAMLGELMTGRVRAVGWIEIAG